MKFRKWSCSCGGWKPHLSTFNSKTLGSTHCIFLKLFHVYPRWWNICIWHQKSREKYLQGGWMTDMFLTNTQLFTSQDINWWTGVVWITCDVFISCLDSHSDGTHSLQRNHWWASAVMLHFTKSILMKKQTHLHLRCPEGKFSAKGTIPLMHFKTKLLPHNFGDDYCIMFFF